MEVIDFETIWKQTREWSIWNSSLGDSYSGMRYQINANPY
jgi:hypothetical protein